MKQALQMVGAGLSSLGMILGLASPAGAHTADFRSLAWGIYCPQPWLETGYGALSYCGETTPNYGGFGWWGPNNVGFPEWGNHPNLYISSSTRCVKHNVLATDGIRGTMLTSVALVYGSDFIRPGVQYTVYLTQPIGRPGVWSYKSQKFHPHSSEWFKTSRVSTSPEHCDNN